MRQFIVEDELGSNGILSLSAKEVRYLTRVLRFKEGSNVDVRHKDGTVQSMSLCRITNNWTLVPNTSASLSAETGVKTADIGRPKSDFTLIQFLPKIQKMDQIVRQAAECGITEVYPVKGAFSNVHDCTERVDRWERIVREARQQSGSPVPTVIHPAAGIEDVLLSINKEDGIKTYKIVLTEVSSHSCSVYSILGSVIEPVRVVIAVGCEGGFSSEEMVLLEKEGFIRLHLKTNVLRVETAALYGTAVIQNAIMENKAWRALE